MTNSAVGPSILDQLWTELDSATDAVMHINPDTDKEVAGKLKGFARGIATAVHVMSTPHFHSVNAVVSCAVERHRNGAADGKAPAVIHTPPPDGKLAAGTDADPIDVPAPRKAGAKLTEQQKTGIASALAGGLDAPTVAVMFGVTEDQVGALT